MVITNEPRSKPDIVKPRVCSGDAAHQVVGGRAMKGTFEKIPASRIALETGTHSPWVSRLLTELGQETIVAYSRSVRLIGESRRSHRPNAIKPPATKRRNDSGSCKRSIDNIAPLNGAREK